MGLTIFIYRKKSDLWADDFFAENKIFPESLKFLFVCKKKQSRELMIFFWIYIDLYIQFYIPTVLQT